jgi:transcriptional regulator with XRE-family HTH domain
MAKTLTGTAVGTRVRSARKLAGLTQDGLALRMNVSTSLLRKVEQGVAPASPSFTAAAAQALGITVYDLYGQPVQRFGEERRDVAQLETAVLAGFDLADPTDDPPQHLDARVEDATHLKRHARYADCAARLPLLLADLHTRAAQARNTADEETAHFLLARAYLLALITLYRLGSPLAATAGDRAVQAAERGGNPALLAMTHGERALTLMHRGAFTVATRITTNALLTLPTRPLDDETHTIAGFLHLRLAILGARIGSQSNADLHLGEAAHHAAHLPATADMWGTAFCITNVQIHRVATAVELGDSALALTRADQQPIPSPTLLPSRHAHHQIDMARAELLHGRRDRALEALLVARQLAPQLTRYHPQARETIVALAERDRRATRSLANFAAWAGVKL